MKVKKSFYASNRKEIKINDDVIKSIAGSNKAIIDLVNRGILNTLMVTSADGGLYTTLSLGKECRKPVKLINLFRAVSVAFGRLSEENLTCLSISSCRDDGVLVSSYCNDECDEMYMLSFKIVGDSLVLSENSVPLVSQSYLIPILEKYTTEVINWCNAISPVPLYNIEYFCVKDRKNTDNIGTGIVYSGFSEATYINGISGIDCVQDNKEGEYSLIFLEE